MARWMQVDRAEVEEAGETIKTRGSTGPYQQGQRGSLGKVLTKQNGKLRLQKGECRGSV